jgi:hypothetical protein
MFLKRKIILKDIEYKLRSDNYNILWRYIYNIGRVGIRSPTSNHLSFTAAMTLDSVYMYVRNLSS